MVVLDPAAGGSHGGARATGVETVDPGRDARTDQIAHLLLDARNDRGMTEDEAARLARTPLAFADGLVRLRAADGCVGGAVHTTADILRTALWLVGPAPGAKTVSSAVYMVLPTVPGAGPEEVLGFHGCAL